MELGGGVKVLLGPRQRGPQPLQLQSVDTDRTAKANVTVYHVDTDRTAKANVVKPVDTDRTAKANVV